MHPVVTCEVCGHRHRLEREVVEPVRFHLLCHSCEGVLWVEVTWTEIRAAVQAAEGRRR